MWGDPLQHHMLPVQGSHPGVHSWPWPKPGYTHELIFRACILHKESSESKASALAAFPFLRANDNFFHLVSKQCYFHPKSLLFQLRVNKRSRQGEASPRRQNVMGGGREAEGGKETPVSVLTQRLRKLKSP